jgi:hypothetical protein
MSPAAIVTTIAVLTAAGVVVVIVSWPRIVEMARAPVFVETLTFADVIRYFASERPDDPRVSSGALMRSPHRRGQLLDQVFLDERDQVCVDASGAPYGRRLIAARLDAELAGKFADLDVIVFR